VRLPFRGWVVSEEGDDETRSIFDMMFIHGTSRFTIADMAERTPLARWSEQTKRERDGIPKEFIAIFHELRLEEVHSADPYAHPLQRAGERGEEWVMSV